jgi:hypothetical protein
MQEQSRMQASYGISMTAYFANLQRTRAGEFISNQFFTRPRPLLAAVLLS